MIILYRKYPILIQSKNDNFYKKFVDAFELIFNDDIESDIIYNLYKKYNFSKELDKDDISDGIIITKLDNINCSQPKQNPLFFKLIDILPQINNLKISQFIEINILLEIRKRTINKLKYL